MNHIKPADIVQMYSGDSADIMACLRAKIDRALHDIECEMLADMIQSGIDTALVLAAEAVHEKFAPTFPEPHEPDSTPADRTHNWLTEEVFNRSILANGR